MNGPRFWVAIGVLVLGASGLAMKGMLGGVELTPIAVPLDRFPMEIAGWVGVDHPLTDVEMTFHQPNDYLRRRYTKDGKTVSLFIVYHGNKLKGMNRVHHNATVCMVAHGWTHDQQQSSVNETVTFKDVAKSIPLSTHYFTRRGADYLVTLFFSIDGMLEGVHRRPKQEPWRRMMDRLTERWAGAGWCIQVQVGTSPGGDMEAGRQRTLRFLRDTMASILRHFPAQVEQ
jgi:EpsI family protein